MQVERSVINENVRNLTNNKDDINEYEPPLKKGPGVGTSSGTQGPQQHVVPCTPPVSTTNLLSPVSSDCNNNNDSCSNNNNAKCNVAASVIANKYLILDQLEASALHMCIDINSHLQYVCKVVSRDTSSPLLGAHHILDCQPHINSLHEVLIGDKFVYLVFPPSYGDLHSYVRQCKRLRESEAKRFFRQMAETVRACHQSGVVLRDLKLRKFVFADPYRTELKLETLEDAVVLEDTGDDCLQDKRGCPAYVSPEILRSHARYSGRAADIWSLGVILYTMLVGRYPFNDTEHASLFAKISRGHFLIPECLSSRAKCLIRSLLRRNPGERLSADDVLLHPWLTREDGRQINSNQQSDQTVPQFQF